jgi:hypothetical protein
MLPKSRKAQAAFWLGVFAVVLTAVLVPGHSDGAGKKAATIPPPRAVDSGTAAGQSAPVQEGTPTFARLPSTPSPAPAGGLGQENALPIAGASYAGSLVLNATGAQLKSWNQTSSYCGGQSWEVPDGEVATDSSDDAVLETTGKPGSCVALISPGSYSSAVIEAYIYFPPLPGKPGVIANWTSFWLSGQNWPADGELDAVEAYPAGTTSAVTWHWGTPDSLLSISTGAAGADGVLPVKGSNITPGWHVVDIVYTRGFFAVYYDGKEYTSLNSGVVTGAPLDMRLTTSVTPNVGSVIQTIGGSPVNSDSSPVGLGVKYVKVWSFK